jgi:hypothetical protein
MGGVARTTAVIPVLAEAMTSLQLFCHTEPDGILMDAVVGGKNAKQVEDRLTL